MRAFGWGDAQEYMMAEKANEANWREIMRLSLLRSGALIGAVTIVLSTLFLFLALVSYSPSDPSFNTAAGSVEHNWMGVLGAYLSDISLSLIGLPVALFLPLLLVFANRLWRDIPQPDWKKQLLWCLLATLLVGTSRAQRNFGQLERRDFRRPDRTHPDYRPCSRLFQPAPGPAAVFGTVLENPGG